MVDISSKPEARLAMRYEVFLSRVILPLLNSTRITHFPNIEAQVSEGGAAGTKNRLATLFHKLWAVVEVRFVLWVTPREIFLSSSRHTYMLFWQTPNGYKGQRRATVRIDIRTFSFSYWAPKTAATKVHRLRPLIFHISADLCHSDESGLMQKFKMQIHSGWLSRLLLL